MKDIEGFEVLAPREPLPELIYRQLRTSILNGTYAPGALLRQEEVAKSFQVSRVPVREAMGRLETDGLLVLRPRRGYAVAELRLEDMVEIFEMRMVLEEHAGYIAARARTQQDIEDVERLVVQMEILARASDNYDAQWAHLNREFHSRLIESCRRKRLANVANTLRDTVEAYVRMEMRLTGDVKLALAEHREIFSAFKGGDAVGLATLCREHVEGTSRRLLDGLRRKTGVA